MVNVNCPRFSSPNLVSTLVFRIPKVHISAFMSSTSRLGRNSEERQYDALSITFSLLHHAEFVYFLRTIPRSLRSATFGQLEGCDEIDGKAASVAFRLDGFVSLFSLFSLV